MKKLSIKATLFALCAALLASCSTESNIKDFIDKKNDKFISSKSDYMYYDSNAFWYEWEEKDYFSNDEILELALDYSELVGRARAKRNEASKYRTSSAPEYRYNSRSEEHARAAERNAHELDSLANNLKQELLEKLKTASIPEKPKGLWVIHTIQYKEYLGAKAWVGPYQKEYLHLMKENGKEAIQSREIYNAEHLFQDFSNITGYRYEGHVIK